MAWLIGSGAQIAVYAGVIESLAPVTVDPGETPTPREEARRVGRFDPTDPPEMGFDHAAIVRDAVTP